MTGFRLDLPCQPTSPGRARRMLAAELIGNGVNVATPGAESALLVVSELVTNAVVHGRSPVTLTAEIASDGATVELVVADTNPAHPSTRRPQPGQVGGWGMALVDRASEDWGVRPSMGADGKQVWATVGLS